MTAAPDVAGMLAGFRSWRIAGSRLHSPFIPCRWDGRLLRATCFDANRGLLRGEGWLQEPHDSPHPGCQCGIYAWNDPALRTFHGEQWWCEGVIAGWGRVEVHADGWRAEHARVEALARPDRGDVRLDAAVERIAADLGVPLVSREALPDVAARTGTIAGDALRPRGAAGRRRPADLSGPSSRDPGPAAPH